MTTTTATQTREAWDAIAADYDRHITAANSALADRALDHVPLAPGASLIDVATGSGALALAAARRGARVTATDLSSLMIERLVARARADGHELDARAMDGHALELPDDAFDVAASQFGVMLFADLPAGLAEMSRVTRPGGRVLMVTMAALPPALEFLGFFLAAVQSVAPERPGPFAAGPPREFQAADREVLHRRMTEAGLTDVSIETIDHALGFRSGADLWTWVTSSNPIGRSVVAGLTDDQGADVRRVLDGMLHERVTDGDGLLHNPVNVAVGTA